MFNNIKPFRFWCAKILPTEYDDALSYYEVLCKVVTKLNEIGATTNEIGNALTELTEYVNNFIGSELNEEVRERLDEMFEDGSLGSLIISELYKNMVFPTMTDVIRASDNLQPNSIVTTIQFQENADYGGAKYKIKTGTIDDFGVYIGNNLVAVPIADFVAPEEIGYVAVENNDVSPYANKIINAGKNIILRLETYYSLSTITVPSSRNTEIKSFNNSTIIYTGDSYLFDIKTGRHNSETEYYTKAKLYGFNAIGNNENYFMKADEGMWGGCFLIDNIHIQNFNKSFHLYAVYNAEIKNSFVRDCGTMYIEKTNTATSYFSNCILVESVVFSLRPITINSPNWLFLLSNSPCIEAIRADNILFTNCTFEGYQGTNIVNGETVRNNSTYCVKSNSPSTTFNFINCWFENLDYVINRSRATVNFMSCYTSNILNYTFETDVKVPYNEIKTEYSVPANVDSLVHLYNHKNTPFFKVLKWYRDSGGVVHEDTANPLYSFGTSEAKIAVPFNSISENLYMVSSFSVNLATLISGASSIGKIIKCYIGVYDGRIAASQFFGWEFHIIKFGNNYRVSPIIDYTENGPSVVIVPTVSINSNTLTVSLTRNDSPHVVSALKYCIEYSGNKMDGTQTAPQ